MASHCNRTCEHYNSFPKAGQTYCRAWTHLGFPREDMYETICPIKQEIKRWEDEGRKGFYIGQKITVRDARFNSQVKEDDLGTVCNIRDGGFVDVWFLKPRRLITMAQADICPL